MILKKKLSQILIICPIQQKSLPQKQLLFLITLKIIDPMLKNKKKKKKNLKNEALAKKHEEEWIEKQKQKEINHQNTIIKIRETRTVNIDFPIIEKTDNTTTGALKGELMGSAAGRTIEGFLEIIILCQVH